MMLPTFNPELLTIPIAHAEERIWTQEEVKQYATEIAEEFGLHKGRFLATLECENRFNTKGQSQHPNRQRMPEWYTPVGDPLKEQSFGVAMINLPSHPGITKEMSENPLFAIPWMAQKFVDGYAYFWTCWPGN